MHDEMALIPAVVLRLDRLVRCFPVRIGHDKGKVDVFEGKIQWQMRGRRLSLNIEF